MDNPVLKGNYFGTTPAIDHNGYTLGNHFYLANYRAGLRIMNISNIDSSNTMNEVGYFDTFPTSNSADYNGAWSVYPYFPRGNIIISDIDRGLFVVKRSGTLSNEEFENKKIALYPNPSNSTVTLTTKEGIKKITIIDAIGKTIKEFSEITTNEFNFDVSDLSSGIYILKLNNGSTKKLIIK